MKQDEDMLGGLQNWPITMIKGKDYITPQRIKPWRSEERKFVRHV
jgi:hypothetical protein